MLVIKTLGGLTIELEGERKRFTARADEALLIYIISHAHPLPRTTLVELLWQNSNPKQANHNFRAALSRLRRVVGDYLMVTRQMIGFDHSRPYYLDADHLEAVLRSLEMPADGRVAAAAARLATAVALYQGDFLAGFSVKGSSPEFDSWLLLVQERLHALAVSGLQQLTRHALQSGQWTNGIQFATQFVRIDPLNELAHQQKMRLHLRNRDRSAALRQYKICRQILADELGVDPLTSTRQLAERLRAATPHAHNLPVDPSPLIGRSAEIRTLVTNLFTPGTRLVTLTGIGGIGKTRVALAAARELDGRLYDGVAYVSLIGTDHPDGLAPAVADALEIGDQLTANRKQSPEEIVADHLSGRESLLILDNYEPLLSHPDATRLIELLLQRAPEVRLLITSREALQLYEEMVIELDGLQTAAPTLFARYAARMRGKPLPADDNEQINQLCAMLAGVPLAIELAAGQTQTETVADIAERIAATLDGLQTTLRNMPPRQRSLRAAFDYSWALLSAPLQLQLARLALFAGDFSEDAAQAIGVEPPSLRALAAKSLLQAKADDRYALHPLIREFADEKLQGEARRETAGRFCDYFGKTFQHWSQALSRHLMAEALAAWRLDNGNVVQAWRLAIATKNGRALLLLNTPLGRFHDWHNWYRAAEALYTEAADSLADWRAAAGVELEAYGDILLRQAWFVYVQGRIREAIGLMKKAEPVIHSAGEQRSIGIWRRTYLQMLIKVGDYAAAQTLANKVLAESDPAQDPEAHGNRLYDSYHVFAATGDYGRAAALIRDAEEIFVELGDTRRVQMCRYARGNIARAQGNYERAIPLLRDCLAVRVELGDQKSVANTQGTLADALCAAGELDEAQRLAEAACEIYAEIPDRIGWPYPLNVLGNIARARGERETAVAHYRAALSMAEETDRPMKVMELLLDWLLLLEDELEQEFFLGGLVTIAEADVAEYEHRRLARQHLERRTAPPYPAAVPLADLKETFQ